MNTNLRNLYNPPRQQKSATAPTLDWPEPETLRNTLQPVYQIHKAKIPEPFRDWILDVSERMQSAA